MSNSSSPIHGPSRGAPAVGTVPPRHSLADDIQGLLTAAVLCALGMSILASGGLMTGGIAGVALLLHHATGIGLGLLFVLANLPFYGFALRRMGRAFTFKTCVAVALTGLVAELVPRVFATSYVHPLFAAVAGGALLGIGILLFIRHRASLGGVGIVVVWLQQTRGWSAGKLQMGFDCAVIALSLLMLPPSQVLFSAIGVVMLNLVLLFNHRPGRYLGA